MSAVYAETSAVLAWLFGESAAAEAITAINQAEDVLTSALTDVEVRRSLIRAQTAGTISHAVAAHLQGLFETVSRAWVVMEAGPQVRARASMPFPVEPVRSLDAIHLATALEFLRAVEDVRVLSFDRRIVDNLEPLGLRAAAPG